MYVETFLISNFSLRETPASLHLCGEKKYSPQRQGVT